MQVIEGLKRLAGFVGMSALLISATAASANTPPYGQRYIRTFQNGSFRGAINYDGTSVGVSEPMTAPLNSAGPLGSMVSSVSAYYTSLETDLGAMLKEKMAGTPFTANPGLLSGPLTLAVSSGAFPGYAAGTLKVSASGPSYSFVASGTTSLSGITANCTIYTKLNSVAFNFYYDPLSGVVLGAEPAALNPTQSVSCTTNLDWIPVLGSFADDIATFIGTRLAGSYIAKWGGQLTTQIVGRRFFGIENYIRPGSYVVNGLDVGGYIVNNLTTILQTSGTVYMTLGGPITDANYQDTGFSATLNVNFFKLGFTNAGHSYSFSLDAVANYGERLVCITPTACPNPK